MSLKVNVQNFCLEQEFPSTSSSAAASDVLVFVLVLVHALPCCVRVYMALRRLYSTVFSELRIIRDELTVHCDCVPGS